MKKILLALLFLTPISYADPVQSEIAEPVNYCLDPIKAKEWEGMRIKYKDDAGIIKLYALRIGLCKAVEDKKINLDMAIDVFNAEHAKLWQERLEQEQKEKSKQKIAI